MAPLSAQGWLPSTIFKAVVLAVVTVCFCTSTGAAAEGTYTRVEDWTYLMDTPEANRRSSIFLTFGLEADPNACWVHATSGGCDVAYCEWQGREIRECVTLQGDYQSAFVLTSSAVTDYTGAGDFFGPGLLGRESCLRGWVCKWTKIPGSVVPPNTAVRFRIAVQTLHGPNYKGLVKANITAVGRQISHGR